MKRLLLVGLPSLVALVAVAILGYVLWVGTHAPTVRAAVPSETVTLYNCNLPYPCERIANDSSSPEVVTIENSTQRQTVTIAAHASIAFEMDSRDNAS